MSLTRRARGFFAPKQFARRPRAPPSAPGSGWVRRRCFRPKPANIGLLGARLGCFFGVGVKKTPGEAFLGARLEMPLEPFPRVDEPLDPHDDVFSGGYT